MKKVLFLGLLLVFVVGCSFKQNGDLRKEKANADKFIIYSLENNQSLSFDELVDKLSKFDIVLLGEKHDELIHHLFEERIYKALSEKKKLNVVFEMLSTNKQSKIDTARANTELKAEDLNASIDWEKGWDWKLYGPLVQMVFYSKDNISGGNISRAEIKTIYEGVQPLNGIKSTSLEVKEKILQIIAASHKMDTKTQRKALEKLTEIQLFKDRRMADVLVHSKESALLVAGRYHTDKSIGVPLHIEDFQSGKSVAVLMLGIDDNDKDFSRGDFLVLFEEN